MFELELKKHDVDIACFSENWMRNSEVSSIQISDYTVAASYCRFQLKNGGVLICYKSSLNVEVEKISDWKNKSIKQHFEITGAIIKMKNALNITIPTINRSTDGDVNTFFGSLKSPLNSFFSSESL